MKRQQQSKGNMMKFSLKQHREQESLKGWQQELYLQNVFEVRTRRQWLWSILFLNLPVDLLFP